MATGSYTTDTGLSALPEVDQSKYPDVWAELLRLRQAINVLQEALDLRALSGTGIPTGGATAEFLGKVSGADYDVAWSAPSHNATSGLQGGSAGQYYHLTSAEYAALGGGAGFTLTQITITVPSVEFGEYTTNVVDATVTATSKILAFFHYAGDDAENGLDELDSMYIFAKANLGSIDFTILHERGAFVGPFVINYAVST